MFKAEVTKYDMRPNGSDDGMDAEFATHHEAVEWVKSQHPYYSRAWINNDEVNIRNGKSLKYLRQLVESV